MVEDLIALCRKGDRRGQRELYERFADKLFRVCYRYLQNQMDAEDALATGFIKIFQNIGTFDYRSKEAFEGWMKKIVVNECLMALRRKKSLKFVPVEAVDYSENFSISIVNLEAEEIYSQILKLPPGYRTVFNLYVIEGFNHKEIGEQLGISENTSKTQLHRAKIMLQELLSLQGITL